MTQLDPRLVRVGIEVSGVLRIYDEGLSITANVVKGANPNQNEATVLIANLSRDVRDRLLTETSPYNKDYTPKRITVQAGRASTGPFTIFSGDIVRVTPTQPPDIFLEIKARTLNFNRGVVINASFGAKTQLSAIAKRVASILNLALTFEATDRIIKNFSFTGPSSQLVEKLGECGWVNAYVDDAKLVVKDQYQPLRNVVHVVSEQSGMIGKPELTENGVRVAYLCDPKSELGGKLTIDSKLNVALNGDYTIYNITHIVASRDTPFYTIADCVRPGRVDIAGIPLLLQK